MRVLFRLVRIRLQCSCLRANLSKSWKLHPSQHLHVSNALITIAGCQSFFGTDTNPYFVAGAKEDGPVMIVPLPSAHKIVILENVWRQIHANVISGKMSGATVVSEAAFHYSRNPTEIRNLLATQDTTAAPRSAFKLRASGSTLTRFQTQRILCL